MSNAFNPDVVFKIAVDIEKSASAFFESAYQRIDPGDAKQLLFKLAVWEKSHIETLEELLKGCPISTKQPTELDVSARRILSIAHDRIFQERESNRLADCRTSLDALNLALDIEKNSVLFYRALNDYVPPESGGEFIKKILHDEIEHTQMISARIKAFGIIRPAGDGDE